MFSFIICTVIFLALGAIFLCEQVAYLIYEKKDNKDIF